MRALIPRTAAVRVAATFALVFLAGSAAVLGSIFLITTHSLDAEADAVIVAEEEGLLLQYEQGGSQAVAQELTRRMDSWGRNGALYLLADPSFDRLAGNLQRWPFDGMPETDWPEFAVLAGHGARPVRHAVRARLRRLPDGDLLLIGTDLSERQAFIHRFAIAIAWGVALTAILAGAAGAWLNQATVRRVAGVADACDSILAGNLSGRMPVSGSGDEFDSLSVAVNRVLERLENQTRTLRTTLDSMAHDLRAPLHRLRNRLDDLGRSKSDLSETTLERIDESLHDVDHLQHTLAMLLQIARAESSDAPADMSVVDLGALATDVAELFGPVAEEAGTRLELRCAEGALVEGNRQLLAQLLTNLLENALAYGRPGGRVVIDVGRGARGASLAVADDGPGIAPEDRERALQPFVRLAGSVGTQGAGLGLSLVAAVARMHRAVLLLEDNVPGLRAKVSFPLVTTWPGG